MGKIGCTEDRKPNLMHLIYRDAKSLGSELDDFENCYKEWLGGANRSQAIPPQVLDALCEDALSGSGKSQLIIILDGDNTRFIGFFLAYADDDKTLRVPMVNWRKSISDDEENALLGEIGMYCAARNCSSYFITALPFQSRLRNAVKRAMGCSAMEVLRVGG